MAAYAIQFRRGNTTQHNSFTGLLGEVTVDTDKKTLVVHDGSTTGGFPLAREGAASNASSGSFTSNVTIGGTLAVTSTASFTDDVSITGDLGMTGHIIPSANITYDLGSLTHMWRDVYVGPGSLYVNGKKVIEDNAGTINITTDVNQNLKVETTGTGSLQLSSAAGISVNGEVNALTGDLQFGDHLDMNSNRIKEVSAPVDGADAANKSYVDSTISSQLSGGTLAVDATTGDFSGDVAIGGSLTVTGTVTTVNSETIELADNILLLNSNALGNASQSGGIEVERGDDLNVQLLWDETNDRWTVGSEDFKAATFIGNLTGDVTGTVSSLSNHDTADLVEGSNLYWTEVRGTANFDANLELADSGDLAEGANLYFTNARARSAISVSGDLTYNATTGVISTQGLASSDSDDLSEGSTNLYFTDARAQSAVATNIATAKSEAISSAQSYADQAELDAVASAEAKDATRAAAANAYADQAELDAIASAEAKDVVRATAAASDATSKADAAQAAAEATASADATAKADQAEADAIASAEAKDVVRASAAAADATAKANAAQSAATSAAASYTDGRETAITTAYTSADTTLQANINTEKSRIDAIMSASTSDADTFAEIVSLVNSVDTTNDSALGTEISNRTSADSTLQTNIDNEASTRASADTALDGRLDTLEGTGVGSVAKALADAQSYADTAEADAIASAEAKDVVRANAASADATAKANQALVDAKAYADTAEVDAKAYTDTRETAITTAYQAYSDTQKSRIDAIMSASTSDADTFAEIVSLVNSVDTTNDNGLSAEISARVNADSALSGRLDVVEGTGAGSVAKALVDAKAYADQAEADAETAAAADATSKANAALASAQSYADQAEVDAIASAEAKDVVRAAAAASDATAKANAAQAAAEATASADATAKADQAEADAIASATNLVSNATGSNLSLANKSTSDLSEGSNQYFTNARAVAAVEASLTHFHSAEQTVSAAVSSANATASVSFTFSELTGADHYAVYLNRQLLRPGEFTANGNATNNLTISTGILAEDDELEVVGFKL